MRKSNYDKLIKFKNSLSPMKHIEEVVVEMTDEKEIEQAEKFFKQNVCAPSGCRRIDGKWFKVEKAYDMIDEELFLKEEERIYTLEKLRSLRRVANAATFFTVLTIVYIILRLIF